MFATISSSSRADSPVGTPLDALLSRPAEERHLGPYVLETPLGRGGFAPVWKAREVYGATEVRTVAIKIFPVAPLPSPPPSSGSPSSRHDPVIWEARALCRVEHPNIVRFHTIHIDESAGVLGLVMEHLAGRSLEQRLREQGPLSQSEAVELALQLSSALQAVHEAGLVHRDLKPANLIEVRGVYKLIDFGISTQETPAPAHPAKRVVLDDLPFEVLGTKMSVLVGAQTMENETARTEGNLLTSGTVGYMDPFSVATGAQATPASDLYGLGAVLFEALTGRLPASSKHGLRGEVLDGRAPPPGLASLVPEASASLTELVHALLCPEREGRPASAVVVHERLLHIQKLLAPRSSEHDPPATPVALTPPPAPVEQISPAQTPSSLGRWLALAAVAALALFAGVRWFSPKPPCIPGATGVCTKRCEAGEQASCHTLGLMYERASGVAKDELRAAVYFQKACDQGHGAACHALGAMREQGRGGKSDAEEARRRYEQACSLGDVQGCNALGIQLSAGAGGPQDKQRALLLFQRACEGGYPNGCANQGTLYEHGDGVEKDEKRARSLYEQACTEGASSSCGLLALALLAGRGGPPDPNRAADLFERACDSGHPLACVGFGVLLEQGTSGHPADRERAAHIYRQACDNGERQGCLHLGQLYQRGDGVPMDEVQAFVLFQRACERGHTLGCRLAGEASATGRGVLKDEARALLFFRRACKPEDGSVSDAEGCAWLARQIREGRGVTPSPEEAEELRQKACEMGATLGCSADPAKPAPSGSGALPGERPPQGIRLPAPDQIPH